MVVAEPAQSRPQAEWNQITAAALDLPESEAGGERPELNDLVNRVLAAPPGAKIQTIERSQTVIAGHPAQLITTQVQENGKPVAVERVAFIDADAVIYTLALRCLPSDFKRLQPVFVAALKSWREAAPPAKPQPGATTGGKTN